jgi:hypothetical protein
MYATKPFWEIDETCLKQTGGKDLTNNAAAKTP